MLTPEILDAVPRRIDLHVACVAVPHLLRRVVVRDLPDGTHEITVTYTQADFDDEVTP